MTNKSCYNIMACNYIYKKKYLNQLDKRYVNIHKATKVYTKTHTRTDHVNKSLRWLVRYTNWIPSTKINGISKHNNLQIHNIKYKKKKKQITYIQRFVA